MCQLRRADVIAAFALQRGRLIYTYRNRLLTVTMSISRSLFDSLKKIIPPLDGSLHKGQSGRVGVIGGAQEYASTFFLKPQYPELT